MDKILIIEDNISVAEFTANVLKSENCNIDFAITGTEAINKITANNYNIVLLDLILPDIEGAEILKTIRKTNSADILPVIVVSSVNDENKIAELLNAGANDFVTKPFSELILKTKVKNQLQLQNKSVEIIQKTNIQNNIIENIPVLSLVVNNDLRIRNVNRTFKEKFNIEETRLKKQLFGKIVQCVNASKSNVRCGITEQCDKCIIRNTVNETYRNKNSVYKTEGKFRLLIDNEIKNLDLQVSTTFLDLKGEEKVLLSIDDVTYEKQLYNQLKISEEKFKAFFNLNRSVMLAINPNTGDIIEANPSARSFYGYKNLSSMKIQDINILPDDKLKKLFLYSKNGVQDFFVFKHKLANGEIKDVELHPTPLQIDGDTILLSIIHDVSDRKKAEQALKESETKYRKIVEATGALVTNVNNQGVLTFVNNVSKKIFGLEPKEAIGRIAFDFVHPNDKEQTNLKFAQWMQSNNDNFEFENRQISVDNKVHYLKWNIRKNRSETDEVIGFSSIALDITKLKKAQIEVEVTSRLNKAIIENSHHGIIVYDPDLKIQVWNPAMEKLTSIPAKDILGKHPQDYFPFLEDAGIIKNYHKILKSGNQFVKEFSYNIPDTNKSGWVVEVSSPLFNSENKIIGVLANVADITDIKELTINLQKSNERFNLAMQGSNDGYWDWDIKTNKLYLSPNWKQQLGYKDYEIENHYNTFERLLHPEDKPTVMQYIDEYLKGKIENYDIEFRMLHKNGENIWIHARGNALRDNKGIPYRMSGSHRDITNIKEMLQELQELNTTKDMFVSILAHDLKNPFSNILGFSDLLLKNINKYDTEKIKKIIQNVNNSAKRTYQLLLNLLEWSKAQQNKIHYNPKQYDLHRIAFEACMFVSDMAQKKHIKIKSTIPIGEYVFFDKEMIDTVLRNLITNAVKFTPEYGTVNISSQKNLDKIRIIVNDTGIGMDENTKNSLFKIDKTQSKEGTIGETGTGLGLLICKEFIEKHKGRITVESELNKGSSFIITLPRKKQTI